MVEGSCCEEGKETIKLPPKILDSTETVDTLKFFGPVVACNDFSLIVIPKNPSVLKGMVYLERNFSRFRLGRHVLREGEKGKERKGK